MNEQENKAFEDDKLARAVLAVLAFLGISLLWIGRALVRFFLSSQASTDNRIESIEKEERQARRRDDEHYYYYSDDRRI